MKQVFIIVLTLISAISWAQTKNDPVIMKINGKDISKSEFEYIYKKNSNDDIIDKKSLEEYLVLFKNFKLKVTEAEQQGLDTTAAFRKELKEYRDQLAKPYLTNFSIDEKLVEKEYDRMKEFIDVSHILINIPLKKDSTQITRRHTTPTDTLESYKKALDIKKRLVNKKEDFIKVALETTDDERSIKSDKPAWLGWVSALMTPPNLENAIYSTKEGQVSDPVRSSFGYHIIKVNKRIQNPGEIRAAHIMVMCPSDADTVKISDSEKKANALYERILNGEDFTELAKTESEDKGTAPSGGDLSWFGFGVMVKEFQDAAFNLKNIGDVSKPVRSQYGFHIIKLLDRRSLASFEDKKSEITNRLERGPAYIDLRQPGIEELKSNNGFSLDEKVYNKLKQEAENIFPSDSIFLSKFEKDNDVLLISGNQPYTVSDFIHFIRTNPNSPFLLSTEYLDERLFSFEINCLVTAEDNSLENKYPDFKNLVNEYRDGILLFEVSNNEVWDKAGKDTTGLKEYFELNKEKYTWDQPHYKGYVVHCKDQKTKKRIQKETSKLDPESAAAYILQNFRVGDVSYVKIEKGLYKEGDNPYVDELIFKKGKAKPNDEFPDFFVKGELLKKPNTYTDVRGLVITDYQNYLEDKWIKELNDKYPVIIYEDVVSSIR